MEADRIHDSLDKQVPPWRKWGAYVSERQWGTVREDYSPDGNAWTYLSHDLARSKSYRWGEDGLAGWSDQFQTLVFSMAFWNGRDPILKERLFGLTPLEGNHGEDVKEYYYYLDATPTHSYMKYLYKYPHDEFPYDQLVNENKKRTPKDREFELVDTGVFANNRYFDIVVEYAKASPDDTCIRIEVFNRGPETASLHLLPHLWFRNRWSWKEFKGSAPIIEDIKAEDGVVCLRADPRQLPGPDWITFDYEIPPMYLYSEEGGQSLFTNNETHFERCGESPPPDASVYTKDAFHRYIIKEEQCINLLKEGTKACLHYKDVAISPQSSHVLRLRLTSQPQNNPLKDVDTVVSQRKAEADSFYHSIQEATLNEDDRKIQREAIAGMIWGCQYYLYDVRRWLDGDAKEPPPPSSRYGIRNSHWRHLHANHIISMPDKWEYPWFASWDGAFHSVVLSLTDLPFAKKQLKTFLLHFFQHPNGQIPAYEWGFSDTNPPVQAWALWTLYQREKKRTGKGDHDYLEFCFLKLMQNFSWWVNKVDRLGNNVFEGGFLGLDNISIIDRSKPLPGGGFFEQSDGTGWMGFYALFMMRMALELSKVKPLFEQLAFVFFEHFVNIACAMEYTKSRPIDLWDDEDGFFYDVILHPDGTHQRLKVRSFVGLIPLYALDFFEEEELQSYPKFYKHFQLYLAHRSELLGRSITELKIDGKKRYLFSLMTLDQINKVLQYAWDPDEFLSPYGLRSLSKYHEQHPITWMQSQVGYEPGESLERIKGGNSNWRGPIWFPTNFLFVNSLIRLQEAVQTFDIQVKGRTVQLEEMITGLRSRLIDLFRKNSEGERPIHGDQPLFQEDPFWKDLVLFYEHYHGDTGRGLGASHQTGWSGLVANLIDQLKKQ
ncbi:MAG: glucosidase [Verrucomicrobia bacterium]|nr:glucosidase [Verrucomicrobiota bacterium]